MLWNKESKSMLLKQKETFVWLEGSFLFIFDWNKINSISISENYRSSKNMLWWCKKFVV